MIFRHSRRHWQIIVVLAIKSFFFLLRLREHDNVGAAVTCERLCEKRPTKASASGGVCGLADAYAEDGPDESMWRSRFFIRPPADTWWINLMTGICAPYLSMVNSVFLPTSLMQCTAMHTPSGERRFYRHASPRTNRSAGDKPDWPREEILTAQGVATDFHGALPVAS